MRRLAALLYFVAALGLVSSSHASEMPRYDHIFIIIAENKDFDQIIGTANAPRLNKFASEYGLSTNFYGEVHPSEANYIAILAGDTFGIHDDDAWYCVFGKIDSYCPHALMPGYANHSISARSLMDQLDEAKLSWKGYFEDLPSPGSTAIYHPSKENPDPSRPNELYAAKHNGFVSFERVRNDPRIKEKIVPLDQLRADLSSGAAPNYAHIVLNQCNEMHGLRKTDGPAPPQDCILDKSKPETTAAVVRRGDEAIGKVVDEIMSSAMWSKSGNSAIVITWDEDDHSPAKGSGCCGYDKDSAANFGGGHIATIVIANHGPRHAQDNTPYNHYSLLRTVEDAFGINEHLGLAGSDGKGVTPMSPLFKTENASVSKK